MSARPNLLPQLPLEPPGGGPRRSRRGMPSPALEAVSCRKLPLHTKLRARPSAPLNHESP